jgi:cell wall-associated NlpC family hydrolase
MSRRRRSRLPKGARTAARILKFLGAGGTGLLLVVCLVIAFAAIGSKYVTTASGETACQLPETTGGPGVEVFGDSTLIGLADQLPARLAAGKVAEDVKTGRTAQQGENTLSALPDSAPAIFVISLAEDDASTSSAYIARIDELMLLLSGRTVYWVTAPGKDAYTKIVNGENTADPGSPESASGWHIVDLAASVKQHPDWWGNGKPTATGLDHLAQTLTGQIAAATSTSTATAGNAGDITVTSTVDATDTFKLAGERLTNAQTIVSVGTKMGVPVRGEVIAIATATQESKLINLPGGPGGAYGLFQQTPSQGWGNVAQVRDPTYAATAFYRHLLAVPGWQDMALTDTAQAVQASAYPDAYAQWEQSATVIVAALLGQHVSGCGPQVNVPGNPKAQVAVNAALAQLGVPYSFDGGSLQGPTLGQCVPGTDGWNDCHVVGFDCSGLMLYAWGKAGVTVPHYTVAMWNDPAFVHITDKSQLQPGDMMMFEGPPPGHTGMYIGNGQLVDAPHSGSVVRLEPVNDPWYAQNYIGALRPKV